MPDGTTRCPGDLIPRCEIKTIDVDVASEPRKQYETLTSAGMKKLFSRKKEENAEVANGQIQEKQKVVFNRDIDRQMQITSVDPVAFPIFTPNVRNVKFLTDHASLNELRDMGLPSTIDLNETDQEDGSQGEATTVGADVMGQLEAGVPVTDCDILTMLDVKKKRKTKSVLGAT